MDRQRLARLHDRDKQRLERLGIDAARRVGFRAQRAVIRAYRARRDAGRALAVALEDLIPILRDGSVAAHLAGYDRTQRSHPRAIAARAGGDPQPTNRAYRVSLDYYRNRLKLSQQDIKPLIDQYTEDAIRILRRATEGVQKHLFRAMEKSSRQDLHVRDGVQALREAFEAAGIEPTNSFTIENLWRTQTAIGYEAGRWEANQDPEIQEILWGYEYTTVGDYRVRPSHEILDGVTLPKDDPFWRTNWPPNGFSCRCSTIEVFEETKTVQPKAKMVDGKLVEPRPDPGFAWNPGDVFRSLQGAAANG